jgi:pimeloyl-ACP methyl ester carboxylesterase
LNDYLKAPDRAGRAAGVPYIAFAPREPRPTTPLIVVLHLMDPPRSEGAMAAALPLTDVDAWKVYLALPMTGERAPAGGFEEIMSLAKEDGLLHLLSPVIENAANELPEAVTALRKELGLESGPLALVGGSAGGAAVLLALIHGRLDVATAAVVNPATQAREIVRAMEDLYGFVYPWNKTSRQVADQLDFLQRADEIARNQTPLLFVVGEDDAISGLPPATQALRDALAERYEASDAVAIARIAGLGHALAEEPGLEPAPQTPGAAEVDARVTAWLQHYLGAASANLR